MKITDNEKKTLTALAMETREGGVNTAQALMDYLDMLMTWIEDKYG